MCLRASWLWVDPISLHFLRWAQGSLAYLGCKRRSNGTGPVLSPGISLTPFANFSSSVVTDQGLKI